MEVAVSWLSFSSFSDVKLGSPPGTPSLDGVPDLDDELGAEGEAGRVVGAMTATESLVDAAVDKEVFEAFEVVLSVNAESLGRDPKFDGTADCAAPLEALMRAASWLRDGRRVGWGFVCSAADMMCSSG